VIAASIAAIAGLVALAGGGTALAFDQTQRDPSGYLMGDSRAYSTDTYALVSNSWRLGGAGDEFIARGLLGTLRIRTRSAQPEFVGIGRAAPVDRYLAGVRREVAARFDGSRSHFRLHEGGAPAAPPTAKHFWIAQSLGSGTKTLDWRPTSGAYRVVVMNPTGSAGVHTELAIGARVPHLFWIGIGALGAGVLLVLVGGGGLYVAVRQNRVSEPQELAAASHSYREAA
jgi:hypothetical protein